MKSLTAFEIRILVNMTPEQLERARDNLLALPRWDANQTRAALAFANEHTRRVNGGPVRFTGPALGISGSVT